MTATTSTSLDTLGARIRQARKDAGYRNAESFAVALGVGIRTVQRLETNKSDPSVGRLRDICALTGRSLQYFITGNDEEEQAA